LCNIYNYSLYPHFRGNLPGDGSGAFAGPRASENGRCTAHVCNVADGGTLSGRFPWPLHATAMDEKEPLCFESKIMMT